MYQTCGPRLHTGMTNNQNGAAATFIATGTANVEPVGDAPLTSDDVVRELRKEALDVFGTRARFAEAMQESNNTVGRYFRGETAMPADFLLRAIIVLGVTPEQFFANARVTRSVPTKGD